MVRTRIGYCGGSTPNPTYRSISDYTETVQLEFDPKVITYEELLTEFWDGHNPFRPASTQYASRIFTHGLEQAAAVEKSKAAFEAANSGRKVATAISECGDFYSGEHYHHKYYLQQNAELTAALCSFDGIRSVTGDVDAFADSALLTKINGFYGGNGSRSQMDAYLAEKAVPAELADVIKRSARF